MSLLNKTCDEIKITTNVSLGIFEEQNHLQECPLDCDGISYETKRTETSFLHHPPIGADPILMLIDQEKKNRNNSHLLNLRNTMTSEEFEQYIK